MKTAILLLVIVSIIEAINAPMCYAFQRYNPFQKEWQEASSNDVIRQNPFNKRFEYAGENN